MVLAAQGNETYGSTFCKHHDGAIEGSRLRVRADIDDRVDLDCTNIKSCAAWVV